MHRLTISLISKRRGAQAGLINQLQTRLKRVARGWLRVQMKVDREGGIVT